MQLRIVGRHRADTEVRGGGGGEVIILPSHAYKYVYIYSARTNVPTQGYVERKVLTAKVVYNKLVLMIAIISPYT